MTKEERMEAANKVLRAIKCSATAQLCIKSNRIAVTWKQPWNKRKPEETKCWTFASSGSTYPSWSGACPWGGTMSQAIGQLVRWVRGRTVLPLSTWEYWGKSGLFDGDEPVKILKEAGYPVDVKCVLCGEPPKGLDWAGKTGGPCCGYARCQLSKK